GSYQVTATFAGNTDYAAASASAAFSIGQASATISITGASVTYDGNGHAATGTASGVESPSPADLTGGVHPSYSHHGHPSPTRAPASAGPSEASHPSDGPPASQAVSPRTDSGQAVVITVPPPAVATAPATAVTTTGATLHGTVNPEGSTATALFQYSTD